MVSHRAAHRFPTPQKDGIGWGLRALVDTISQPVEKVEGMVLGQVKIKRSGPVFPVVQLVSQPQNELCGVFQQAAQV
jgi:hypothetical protein